MFVGSSSRQVKQLTFDDAFKGMVLSEDAPFLMTAKKAYVKVWREQPPRPLDAP